MRLILFAFIGMTLNCFFGSIAVHSQDQSLRVSMADMTQDLSLMDRQLRALKLEIEALKENQKIFEARSSIQDIEGRITRLETSLLNFKNAYTAQEKQLSQKVLAQVAAQMDAYIETLNASLSVRDKPVASTPKVFSDDYPKTGLSYEVQSGDTLSQIAAKFGSRVQYIQNANSIKDPSRDLRIGDTIFIPITEDN
jgi:LysM repeat protein